VRYAVNIPPFTDAHMIVDMAVDAEEAGWDAVFVWDHLRWIVALDLDVHDPWSLLAAMAMRTSRVQLGTCVTPVPRRRPHVLAKQLVTLDHLSGGRAMLGVGLGEPPDADFADLGDDPDPVRRGERLDEGLAVIAGLASGQRVDHDGAHYQVHAEYKPASVQRPRPPIFVAGTAFHRKPLLRSLRFEGFFPIGHDALLAPADVAKYVEGIERPAGWQLFAARTPEHSPEEFEAVGVDWLCDGAWPMGDWVTELRDRIRAGPRQAPR
jgi:alkanesulfonate monooxygenase SsuD/methylene tetrahydromethanopterin reductase-like flavin-dependent oxidoreductase (luciferase family)